MQPLNLLKNHLSFPSYNILDVKYNIAFSILIKIFNILFLHLQHSEALFHLNTSLNYHKWFEIF